jgi:WD40 repeat protein
MITQIIELVGRKLIVSSSLDGVIKLWDLNEKIVVAELKDPNQ